jgi:hypothetical protein
MATRIVMSILHQPCKLALELLQGLRSAALHRGRHSKGKRFNFSIDVILVTLALACGPTVRLVCTRSTFVTLFSSLLVSYPCPSRITLLDRTLLGGVSHAHVLHNRIREHPCAVRRRVVC